MSFWSNCEGPLVRRELGKIERSPEMNPIRLGYAGCLGDGLPHDLPCRETATLYTIANLAHFADLKRLKEVATMPRIVSNSGTATVLEHRTIQERFDPSSAFGILHKFRRLELLHIADCELLEWILRPQIA